MKIFNKYTYLFLGLLIVAAIVVINFIPDLETEDFDQEVIDNIIEGVTTTTEPLQNQEIISSEQATEYIEDEEIIIAEEDLPKIEDLLKFNQFEEEINNFDAYLLIGSDERSAEIAETRGKIQGKSNRSQNNNSINRNFSKNNTNNKSNRNKNDLNNFGDFLLQLFNN